MKNPMPFSERIKTLREDHGWSQEDLSHKTGISEAILGELETQPEVHVDSGMHLVFANVFERSVLEIVKGTSIEEFLSDSFMPKFCINHEEIITAGDQENDYLAAQAAGLAHYHAGWAAERYPTLPEALNCPSIIHLRDVLNMK